MKTIENNMLKTIPHKQYLYGVLLLTIIGGLLAYYSTQLTYQLAGLGSIGPGSCHVNTWINCESVLSTPSAMAFGIPVAWFGFLYYLFITFTILLALLSRKQKQIYSLSALAILLSGIAVFFSFYKAYELFQLKVLCPVCVGMYLVNIGIFILVMKSCGLSLKKAGHFLSFYMRSFFRKNSSQPTTAIAIVTTWVFIVGFLGVHHLKGNVPKPEEILLAKYVEEHFQQTPIDIKMDANGPYKGNLLSGVTIVEFSDFECPACKMLSSVLQPILEEYQNEVAFHFVNYPLDISINQNLKREIHKNAGMIALAGICAQQNGDFWNFHDSVFQTEETLNRDFILQLAESKGWDLEDFGKCMDAPETRQRVLNDIQAGSDAKITGTPSLFINGRPIKYWNNPEFIKAVIEAELKIN